MTNTIKINDYTDLYGTSNLKTMFGDKASEIGKIPFDIKNPFVDLNSIAKILGLTVSETDLSVDGFFKSQGKMIELNKNVSEGRKRFTLAHEMAHSINSADKENLQFRKFENYTPAERRDEQKANQLAAELLMPNKKLLVYLMKEALNSIGANPSGFDNFERDRALSEVAAKLKVSSQSLKYRLQNLRILGK